MNVQIECRQFELTSSLKAYVKRRALFNFSTKEKYIKTLHVRFADINGPRGGTDKSCLLHVVMPGIKDVIVEDIEDDLYFAIDRAFERAKRAVKRQVMKHRRISRSQPRLKLVLQ